MKIKNGALELLETSQVLKNLFEAKDIPIEVSFRLAEFAYKLEGPVKIYISEKQKLVKRFADRDQHNKLVVQNGQYIVTKKTEAFATEWQKLADMEIDIDKPTIQLGSWAQGKISTKDMRELSVLIRFTFQKNNLKLD